MRDTAARIAETEADNFNKSWWNAASYPINLVHHDTYDHILRGYLERLNEHGERIFVEEENALLTMREYDESIKGFKNITTSRNADFRGFLVGNCLLDQVDPQCRFIFIHAAHARERLKITREMFTSALTYHQVSPLFLDFVFPFGKQKYMQDFQFSGFRSEDWLLNDERRLQLPQLGRSGRGFQLFYNLKSVEPSKIQKEWPWSIRQTAVSHAFDAETGKALWFIIKGDQLMRRRIEVASQVGNLSGPRTFNTLVDCFSSTFQVHNLIFDWCREHWRWYLNFLEQETHKLTRNTLFADLDRNSCRGKPSLCAQTVYSSGGKSCKTKPTQPPKPKSFKFGRSSKADSRQDPVIFCPGQRKSEQESEVMFPSNSQEILDEMDEFKFSDLQNVQSLEEKAAEAILVLDTNISSLVEAKSYYREIVISPGFPVDLQIACIRSLARFEKKIASVVIELQREQARAKDLLRLLTDRKNLLYGILDFRNMESNRLLASKTQISTAHMETLTEDMHSIARKTKQETVSMRIITLVTLFFLPGTFISTLMSTDILQYTVAEDGQSEEVFQQRALRTFLAITIPIMVLTFAAWYVVSLLIDRKEREKAVLKVGLA